MLREDQVRRYARHILLPDVGGVGQERFLAAAVEVEVGPDRAAEIAALAYLAAAGVGRLVLRGDAAGPVTEGEARDGILLGHDDVGRARIEAIRERVGAINPDVRVEPAAGRDAGAMPLAQAPAWGAVPGAYGPDEDAVGDTDRNTDEPLDKPVDAAMAHASGVEHADAVANALIHGGARAVRTLARLARPNQ